MKEGDYSPKTMIHNSLSFALSMYMKVIADPAIILLLTTMALHRKLVIVFVPFPTFVQHFGVQELF